MKTEIKRQGLELKDLADYLNKKTWTKANYERLYINDGYVYTDNENFIITHKKSTKNIKDIIKEILISNGKLDGLSKANATKFCRKIIKEYNNGDVININHEKLLIDIFHKYHPQSNEKLENFDHFKIKTVEFNNLGIFVVSKYKITSQISFSFVKFDSSSMELIKNSCRGVLLDKAHKYKTYRYNQNNYICDICGDVIDKAYVDYCKIKHFTDIVDNWVEHLSEIESLSISKTIEYLLDNIKRGTLEFENIKTFSDKLSIHFDNYFNVNGGFGLLCPHDHFRKEKKKSKFDK